VTLHIRLFDLADTADVLSLHQRALAPTGAYAGEGPWDEDLLQIEQVYIQPVGTFLVGTLEGRLVAMGALKRTDSATAEIKRMRVEPAYQRQGYGQAVLSALEQCARELTIKRLFLDTGVVQSAAQRLYEKNGYSPFATGDFHGIPIIYYEKQLVTADGRVA
jgi:GNAT superfamily N-acetyltransferase